MESVALITFVTPYTSSLRLYTRRTLSQTVSKQHISYFSFVFLMKHHDIYCTRETILGHAISPPSYRRDRCLQLSRGINVASSRPRGLLVFVSKWRLISRRSRGMMVPSEPLNLTVATSRLSDQPKATSANIMAWCKAKHRFPEVHN